MNLSHFPPGGAALPVLLVGTAPLPPEGSLYPLEYAPEQVAAPEHFASQLCFALQRSNAVVVLGGFYGDIWPAMAAVCGAVAYAAGVPETEVRFRWVNEGDVYYGAEFEARGKTVYAVPNDINLVPRMLHYVTWALGGYGRNVDSGRQPDEAPAAEPAAKPKKKRKKLKTASTVVLIIAMLVSLGSGGWLINFALEEGRSRRLHGDLSTRFNQDRDRETEPVSTGGVPQRLSRFDGLYADNDEIVGWLNIPAAEVDLPVVQRDCNEFYLYHDFNRRFSRYGTLFLDQNNEFRPGEMCLNLSIYGHNTRNGSMFGRLSRFRNASTLQENPTFTFTTLYEELEWVIFAMFISNADPRQDNGNFFEWRNTDLDDPERMEELLEDIMDRSMMVTGVDVAPGDRLLSLTTCTSEFRDARFVVFARLVRPDEEIDLSGAAATWNFRRPAAWR